MAARIRDTGSAAEQVFTLQSNHYQVRPPVCVYAPFTVLIMLYAATEE